MTTRNQVLALAASQVGYLEGGGRDGRSGNITKYWAKLKPSYQGGAWCAAFVNWCLTECGLNTLNEGPTHPYYTPSMESWAKANGRWKVSKDCKPGDVLIFGGSSHATHTGFLLAQDGNYVLTIEGNTSPGAGGSQTNGGGVYRRRRPRSWVRGCISLDGLYSEGVTEKPVVAKLAAFQKVAKGEAVKPALRISEDGEMGPETRYAFEAYQKRKVDGAWDRDDVRALQSWVSRERTGRLSTDDIKAIQKKLGVGSDGSWGPKTTGAFQRFLNRRFAEAHKASQTV